MIRTIFNRAVKWTAVISLAAVLLLSLEAEGPAQTARRKQAAPAAPAAGLRSRLNINKGWRFLPEDTAGAEAPRYDDSRWRALDLPHTWNVEDTLDDEPGYRMGAGWYRKALTVERRLKGKRLFLYFEGAHQVADVYVNGRLAGRHVGGYTGFAFDVTDLIRFDTAGGRNLVAVRVDNSIDRDIPPSPTADFNLYGGIYRDVWLVATDPVHVTLLDYASPGVYVDTPSVSEQSAVVRVRGTVVNDTNRPLQVRVVNTVLDAAGQAVAETESVSPLRAGEQASFEQLSAPVPRPRLWSPESPYLYTVRTRLYDGAQALDEVENPLGFRWFSFDADRGFFLNGQPLRLRGTNRHQDYAGLGNAVPDQLQVRDMELIKEMGANCVLLAHYPHDPVVLEAADRLGLIVWEEVPIVREISTTEEFTRNCKRMLTEMIRQHYNHPSVLMWCYMNEIFLRMRDEPGYVQKTVELAKALDQLAREEDAGRATVISVHRPISGSDIYDSSGLTQVPQVVGWHMYFGWYYGRPQDLGRFLDEQHRRFPKRKIFVSEYGADSDGRLHSLRPLMGDSTVEWAQAYHESYMPQIEARPYLAGSAVWSQFEFGSEARGDSTPHVNTKGVFTFDRKPKDIYYYYQALLSKEPVLHIAAREWHTRAGAAAATTGGAPPGGGTPTVRQPVKVYSNLPEVELFVNGSSLGTKPAGASRRVSWDASFHDGVNVIEARGRAGNRIISDRTQVRFNCRAPTLSDEQARFAEMAVNLGSNAQYIDDAGLVWEADQSYSAGGWGYVGGTPGRVDRNILDSPDDPLYQTVRQGLREYRFDVPDGDYEVELRFAEHRFTKPGERVFSVALNGDTVVKHLDLVKDRGALRAVSRKFPVKAARGLGVVLQFTAHVGETVASAIRVRRLR